MDDTELVKRLSFSGKYRNTLYLAAQKIERYYIQKVALATEITRNKKSGGKVSASLFTFLGADVSEEKSLAAKVAITPMLQAIAAENAARQSRTLVDLISVIPSQGELLLYVGPARFIRMNEPLVPEMTEFPGSSCERISERRRIQEEILRMKDDKIRTVVLIFAVHDKMFASIASTEFIEYGLFGSYYAEHHFGILCTMEGKAEREVTFLDPLWIWHEA